MKPYKNDNTKTEQIKFMFDNIAPTYDLLNHLLTFGIDHSWRKCVAKKVNTISPSNIVDVATGTGDLAITLARKCTTANIVGVDLSANMIEVAKAKIQKQGLEDRISLIVEDVEKMDFPKGGFDAATVAFGVRNFQDIDSGLASICKVVRQGGMVVVLEFSTPKNKIFAAFYRFYFHKILPFIGGLLSKDKKAYRYLPESVDEFPSPEAFMAKMEACSLSKVEAKALMFGAAYVYSGYKI